MTEEGCGDVERTARPFGMKHPEVGGGLKVNLSPYAKFSQLAYCDCSYTKVLFDQYPPGTAVSGERRNYSLLCLARVVPSVTARHPVLAASTAALNWQSPPFGARSLSGLPIPDPPTPPDLTTTTLLAEGVEPSFESVGLGGWSPVGIVQNCMEFLHVSCSLPWWTSIVVGTIVVRCLMFPLVIISQRNAAKMNNNLPGMQKIQLKMTEARERGDRLNAARHAQELMQFMKEKNLNPLKNMIVPFAQAPLFISFFVGLRGMSNLPIDSMHTGGMLWFVDLTVPDQFYLLPLITSATLALTIEVGTDAARLNSANMGMMKYFLRAMPFFIFPFTINFSNAILVYWVSSNFISLMQVMFLRLPKVREYFKIEKMIVHEKTNLPIRDKGFVRGVSESWTNMKLTRELEERQRIDEMNFMRAGRGAVKKTFKYNPTQPPPTTIQAKKRDA